MVEQKRQRIVIPYQPTKLWREKIHPNLENHRFSVIVAHRRFGKTVGTVNHMIKMAIKNRLRAPRYAYVAPYRYQAKQIAWEYLKFYTHVLPGVRVNESELYVEMPSRFSGSPGARIYIIGADNPDALRGGYWDGTILDEYAQIRPELWNEVIRPAVADRRGWVVFIGTPKGQNQFYEIWQKAQREKDWYVAMYRADESGLFDDGGRYGPEELKAMKQDMNDTAVRQELYCDFTASATNVLITIDLVTAAAEKGIRENDVVGSPLIFGVDVARFGDDRCTIFPRRGLAAYKPIVFSDIDNMTFAAELIREIDRQHPDAVFVDAGRGEGVIDRCRQLGYYVTEINFGAKAGEPNRYINKRSEMWDKMRQWMMEGGCIPPDMPDLKTELTTPEYGFDAANRMRLEKKEDIKARLGRSPDIADGLALTFALPVAPGSAAASGRMGRCETEYDPF